MVGERKHWVGTDESLNVDSGSFSPPTKQTAFDGLTWCRKPSHSINLIVDSRRNVILFSPSGKPFEASINHRKLDSPGSNRGEEGRVGELEAVERFECWASWADADVGREACNTFRWNRGYVPGSAGKKTSLTVVKAVATVLSNWNNVLHAITMASSMFSHTR